MWPVCSATAKSLPRNSSRVPPVGPPARAWEPYVSCRGGVTRRWMPLKPAWCSRKTMWKPALAAPRLCWAVPNRKRPWQSWSPVCRSPCRMPGSLQPQPVTCWGASRSWCFWQDGAGTSQKVDSWQCIGAVVSNNWSWPAAFTVEIRSLGMALSGSLVPSCPAGRKAPIPGLGKRRIRNW